MKKIILFIVLGLMMVLPVCAQTNSTVSFNGKSYVLKYSEKMQTGAFINEYYLPAEKYGNWTKLIGVFDYPQINDPLTAANALLNNAKSKNYPGQIWVNKEKNSAVVSFIVFTDGGNKPLKAEINFFKYEKSPKKGTIALQYAERHVIKNDAEYEKFKTYINARIPEIAKLMTNAPMPKLVEKNIDLGK